MQMAGKALGRWSESAACSPDFGKNVEGIDRTEGYRKDWSWVSKMVVVGPVVER